MSLRRNFLSGMVSGAGAVILKTGFNLLLIPLLIRFFGAGEYGFYLFLISFSDFLLILDLGLTTGLTQRLSLYLATQSRAKVEEQLGIGHLLYGCVAIALILAGWMLQPALLKLFRLENRIAGMALNLAFVDAACNLYACYFQAILKSYYLHKWTNLFETGQAILNNLVSVVLLFMGFDLISLLIARVLISSLKCVGLLYRAVRVEHCTLQSRLRFPLAGFQDLFGISGFAMVQTASMFLAYRMDDLVIAASLTMRDVAIYGILYRLIGNIYYFCFKISEGIFPLFSRLSAELDPVRARRFFLRISQFLNGLVGLLFILLFFNYPEAVLFLGSGQIDVAQSFPIACIVAVITWSGTVQLPATNYLFASGLHRSQTVFMFVSAVLNLGISLSLVRSLGLTGVALGTLIPHFIQHQAINVTMACRQLGIPLAEYFKTVHLSNFLPFLCAILILAVGRYCLGWSSVPFLPMMLVNLLSAGIFTGIALARSPRERELIRQRLELALNQPERVRLHD